MTDPQTASSGCFLNVAAGRCHAKGLVKDFEGWWHAVGLRGMTTKLNRGDAVAVTSPSGIRKSTLLYIVRKPRSRQRVASRSLRPGHFVAAEKLRRRHFAIGTSVSFSGSPSAAQL